MNIAFLRRAIKIAEEKSKSGINGPFGAVVARGDEILGEGWNQVVENNDPTAHAEIVAIRNACSCKADFRLQECTIYCNCEPCPMCLSAIYWARIPEIVYACTRDDATDAGFDDALIYDEIGSAWNDRSIKRIQAERETGKKVFQKWLANQDRINY
ncbi:MAG: nucleoside deaminase [Desulfobulbaceae bacterium]|nr:nucleoside deaminase [Desulfobulbaceae bacterium]